MVFASTPDQFVSPAFEDPLRLAEFASQDPILGEEGKEAWAAAAAQATYTYDLRRAAIHNCIVSLAELKRGKSLNDDQACDLHNFSEFLTATVAPQQFHYPEIDENIIQKWISELGLSLLYPSKYDWQDILGNVQSVAFYNAWAKRNLGFVIDKPAASATPEQNQLAGRYLSALCMLAEIAGPRKKTPAVIIQRFYEKYREDNR